MRPWAALILAAWVGGAVAQSGFPAKPVRLVVTSPPGGANDTLNRALAAKVS